MSRIFAISDIHIDFRHNREWLETLSLAEHRDDALVLAGDVTDIEELFQAGLEHLMKVFRRVFFVPGNHDLWLRRSDCAHSLEKFRRVMETCEGLGVETRPARIEGSQGSVWVVPLLSWYEKPEEGAGSLFLPKPGEDPTLSMWADNHFTRWPPLGDGETVAAHFLRMNERHVERGYDAPVVSFSHFLPRADLIFSNPEHACGPVPPELLALDPNPAFNFSRVAGCHGLEEQIRRLGSAVHVYGHQHRNRWRRVDGVLYVSHCLGYAREKGGARRLARVEPRQVWPPVAEGG